MSKQTITPMAYFTPQQRDRINAPAALRHHFSLLAPPQDEAATLYDIYCGLIRARKSIATGALIGAGIALIILLITVPQTRSFMTIAPAKTLTAGTEIPTQSKNIAIFRALTNATANTSPYFTQLLATLSAAQTTQKLLNDTRLIEGLKADKKMHLAFTQGNWTSQKLSAYIKQRVKIIPSPNSDLVTLEYWHASPEFARYFLTQLHSAADGAVKESVQIQAKQRLSYVRSHTKAQQSQDHKRMLSQLALEQERLLMLSNIDQPFAADVINSADHAHKTEWPSKPLLLILLTMLGALGGAALHHIRSPEWRS